MRLHWSHFQLARETHRPIHELLGWRGPMTHRQFKAWQEWEREQWNHPSRDNWYEMQTACEVRRVLMKDKSATTPQDFKMRFVDPKPVQSSPQEGGRAKDKYVSKVAISQAVAKVGGNVTVTFVDKHGNPVSSPVEDK